LLGRQAGREPPIHLAIEQSTLVSPLGDVALGTLLHIDQAFGRCPLEPGTGLGELQTKAIRDLALVPEFRQVRAQ
jgi:hypothetical protein